MNHPSTPRLRALAGPAAAGQVGSVAERGAVDVGLMVSEHAKILDEMTLVKASDALALTQNTHSLSLTLTPARPRAYAI